MKTRNLIDITAWVRLVCFGMALITRAFDLNAYGIAWLLFPAVLTGVFSIYLQKQNTFVKYLPLLLCGLYVIPQYTTASLITLAAVLSSCILFTMKNAWTATRSGVEKMLYRGLGAYVLFAVPMFLKDGSWEASIAFLTVFLSFTIFDLRVLRSERIGDASYVWINFVVCILLTVVLLAICTPVFRQILKMTAELFAHYILMPLLWLVIMTISLLVTLLLQIIAPVFLLFGKKDFHPSFELEIFDFSALTGEDEELVQEAMHIPDVVWFIGLTLILAVLVYFAVRRIRRTSLTYTSMGTIERKQLTDRPFLHRSDNVSLNPMRTLYVKYLRRMKKEGMDTDPCDTSLMQASRADGILQNTWGQQMREYWLPARYGKDAKTDLSGARDLYKKIRRWKRED